MARAARRRRAFASQGPFDGLGLRGNDSTPVTAEGVRVPESRELGDDGAGFDIMMGIVLPLFNVLSAAVFGRPHGEPRSQRTAQHASGAVTSISARRSPTCRRSAPTSRGCGSRPIRRERCCADTLAAIESGRADAMLRVLECKAAAGEAATEVVDLAMRVCGGAAFRKEVGVER